MTSQRMVDKKIPCKFPGKYYIILSCGHKLLMSEDLDPFNKYHYGDLFCCPTCAGVGKDDGKEMV